MLETYEQGVHEALRMLWSAAHDHSVLLQQLRQLQLLGPHLLGKHAASEASPSVGRRMFSSSQWLLIG